jgi:1,4-dihydroxy-2-naphthoyl-CoA hydrolase
MTFSYRRTVYLGDTDAAGVVYFASAMHICHEAYEESLAAREINLQQLIKEDKIAIPIISASINFFRPMFCGDRLQIDLVTTQISEHEFTVGYQIILPLNPEKTLVQATTKHICIDARTRSRILLPKTIMFWLNSYSK